MKNELNGTWTKYNGEWCACIDRQALPTDSVIESREVIGGGYADKKITYATLTTKAGKSSIVEITEYLHRFNDTAHIYSVVPVVK